MCCCYRSLFLYVLACDTIDVNESPGIIESVWMLLIHSDYLASFNPFGCSCRSLFLHVLAADTIDVNESPSIIESVWMLLIHSDYLASFNPFWLQLSITLSACVGC